MSTRILIVALVLVLVGIGGGVAWVLKQDSGDELDSGGSVRFESDAGPASAARRDVGTGNFVPDAEPERGPAEEAVEEPEGGGASVRGRAIDPDGAPLVGAEVRLELLPADARSFRRPEGVDRRVSRTDAEGRFELAGLPGPRRIRLVVRSELWADLLAEDRLEADAALDLGTLRAAAGGEVAGRVTDERGLPLEGVTVLASVAPEGRGLAGVVRFPSGFGLDDEDARRAVSDLEGNYRIRGLDAGVATVSTAVPDRPDQQKGGLRVGPTEPAARADFTLSRGRDLRGRVVGAEGLGLEGAEVVLIPGGGGFLELALMARGPEDAKYSAVTDAEGRFVIPGLDPEKDYVARVDRRLHVSARRTTITPQQQDVEITLQPSPVLRVRVLDEDGDPLVEGVEAESVGGGFRGRAHRPEVLTGEAARSVLGEMPGPGEVVVADIRGDDVRLALRAPRRGAVLVEERGLEPGEVRRVEARLELGVTLSGRVLDPSGEPIADARVVARGAPRGPGLDVAQIGDADLGDFGGALGSPLGEARSAADGTFAIEALPKGTVLLQARHPDFLRSRAESLELAADLAGHEIVLERAASIRGRVLDREGAPVHPASVVVEAARSGGGDPNRRMRRVLGSRRVSTNRQGEYVVENLRPGDHRVRAERGGSGGGGSFAVEISGMMGPERPAKGELVTLVAGEERRLDLILEPKAAIFGEVRSGGRGVADLEVRLVRKGDDEGPRGLVLFGMGGRTARTDSRGRYEFEDLDASEYEVVVEPPGTTTKVGRALVVAGTERARCDLELPGGAVRGTVLDASTGLPIRGASVRLATARAERGEETERDDQELSFAFAGEDGEVMGFELPGQNRGVRTDESGRFELLYVQEGAYDLSVRARGYVPNEPQRVEVGRSAVEGVNVALTSGSALAVTVRYEGAADEASPFAVCTLTRVEGGGPTTRFGALGSPIRFAGVRPGVYVLEARVGERTVEREVVVRAGIDEELTLDVR